MKAKYPEEALKVAGIKWKHQVRGVEEWYPDPENTRVCPLCEQGRIFEVSWGEWVLFVCGECDATWNQSDLPLDRELGLFAEVCRERSLPKGWGGGMDPPAPSERRACGGRS